MIPIYNYNELTYDLKQKLFFRKSFEDIQAYQIANEIIEKIKKEGKKAVIEFTRQLDKYNAEPLVLTKQDFEVAESQLSEKAKKAFLQAALNIKAFHEFQRENLKNEKFLNKDATLGYLYTPVDTAAVYIPGGKAKYPSSVLMGVIPAKIAGVKHVTVITPADENGNIDPSILYCCKISGADVLLKVGGAQGIASAFFGIDVPPAQVIVGPGNRYVTAAKNIIASTGKAKIDSPAGPSEILIIANVEENARFIAADLLSQAEHGEDSVCVLLTDSLILAENVITEIKFSLEERPKRRSIKEKSIKESSFIILFNNFQETAYDGRLNLEHAFDIANEFAPEHLEICLSILEEPESYLKYVKSAGSVFIGTYAPVALGDYFSGTNHILPTGGSAKMFSGLGVDTFLKRITWQYTTREGLKKALEPILTMSEIEGLDEEHGNSIKIRFQ